MEVNLDRHIYGPFKESEIKEVLYYLTPPGTHVEDEGIVRLAAKLKLWSGEQYGNVIEIPFVELKRLVAQYESCKVEVGGA